MNLQLFRGFATSAAAREGHYEILEILLKAGASQSACEEALLEASSHGHSQLVELLMGSDLIRPHAAIHALVTACCRGFVEVVDTLMKVYLPLHIWYNNIGVISICYFGRRKTVLGYPNQLYTTCI